MQNKLFRVIKYSIFLWLFIGSQNLYANNFIDVIHDESGKTIIYIKTYSGKKFLVYKTDAFLSEKNWSQIYVGITRHILWVSINDRGKKISIYGDLKDEKVSQISNNNMTGINNYFKKVTVFYNKEKNIYMIIPIFETCKKPFTYKDTIKTNGPELHSTFLPNGDLYIKSYKVPGGKEHFFTIKINYQKLFADCDGK